jgi:hypothetical protein
MKSLIVLLSLSLSNLSTSLAQGKWSMGFTMASRSEWRLYEDSYQYLFKGSGQGFSFGGSLAYQHNDKCDGKQDYSAPLIPEPWEFITTNLAIGDY